MPGTGKNNERDATASLFFVAIAAGMAIPIIVIKTSIPKK
ncbi:hypothetical protein F385_3256 [Pantoea agglomerans 299R]|nr:hypothetical protein F385_3256 [Pantoea agglomerans 299R]